MTYRSGKTWGHDVGLSCCFRQWRAKSHCNLLHGYALSVHVEFEADLLDSRNWVVDFGSLKGFKEWLVATFDHKLLVAEDDPRLPALESLELLDLASIVKVPATGCEAFAELIFDEATIWLGENDLHGRVQVHHVTVREHGANSASYYRRGTN